MTGHAPLRELPVGQFAVADNGDSAMPVIPLDAAQTIVGGGTVTLDTLHEIEPVEQDRAGNAEAGIIPSCSRHDRQQVLLVQSRPGGTHINEGGDRLAGHW